jgi:CTP-dependent riboflavin kinase
MPTGTDKKQFGSHQNLQMGYTGPKYHNTAHPVPCHFSGNKQNLKMLRAQGVIKCLRRTIVLKTRSLELKSSFCRIKVVLVRNEDYEELNHIHCSQDLPVLKGNLTLGTGEGNYFMCSNLGIDSRTYC